MSLWFDWPFVALAGGVLGLLALLARPRWRDPAWLACLMLPVYMLHQFEEHGFDVLGRRFHFIVEVCTTLRMTPCPADPVFIFAVNPGAVWIAGAVAILLRRRNPKVAAFTVGLPLVNAVAHTLPAILRGAYNSGVVTGLVLFVPLCVVVLGGMRRAGAIARADLPFVVLTGVLMHVILAGALVLLPRDLMLAVEVLNGLVPLAIGTLRASPSPAASRP